MPDKGVSQLLVDHCDSRIELQGAEQDRRRFPRLPGGIEELAKKNVPVEMIRIIGKKARITVRNIPRANQASDRRFRPASLLVERLLALHDR